MKDGRGRLPAMCKPPSFCIAHRCHHSANPASLWVEDQYDSPVSRQSYAPWILANSRATLFARQRCWRLAATRESSRPTPSGSKRRPTSRKARLSNSGESSAIPSPTRSVPWRCLSGPPLAIRLLRSRLGVVEGMPADAILKLAAEVHADAIVMGTHGRTGYNRWMLGSVAERAWRDSSAPVLTVLNEPERPIRHILCPVSDTDVSREALRVAAGLAGVSMQPSRPSTSLSLTAPTPCRTCAPESRLRNGPAVTSAKWYDTEAPPLKSSRRRRKSHTNYW